VGVEAINTPFAFDRFLGHVPPRFQEIHREFLNAIDDLDFVVARPSGRNCYVVFVDGLDGHVLQVAGTVGELCEENDLIAVWNPSKLGDSSAADMYKAAWSDFAETPSHFHSSSVNGGLRAVGVETVTNILASTAPFVRS